MELSRYAWTDAYPSQDRLRREVDAMAHTHVDALTSETSAGEIESIYLKGSTNRPWDTILDYVPEASDLDVHVRFADDGRADEYFHSLDWALVIQGAK